jgi:hypothetical protein
MLAARRVLLPVLLAVLSAACARRCGGLGGGPPGGLPLVEGKDGVKRYLDDRGAYKAWYDYWGRLERIEQDKDRDGRLDAIAHYQGGRVARMLEIDENLDGAFDRWEFYDESGVLEKVGLPRKRTVPDMWTYPGPDGTPRRIDYDEDGDGQVERVELLEKGLVVGLELDADRDGKTDRWQRWVLGKLRGEELDTNADGKPDRRLAFDEKGQILGVQKIE